MLAFDSGVIGQGVGEGRKGDGGRERFLLVATVDKSIGVTSVNSREIGTGRRDSG